MRLSEVAQIVSGIIYGNKNFVIKNILPPEDAKKYDLTFLFDNSYRTEAGAIIATKKVIGKNCIIVKEPKKAMFKLLKGLSKKEKVKSIAPQSIIEEGVSLPKHCVIEPYCVIKRNAIIGNGTYIGAHCFIDEGVVMGKKCAIHHNTVIYKNTMIGNFVDINSNTVIGKEGFGFIKLKNYGRIKHIGGVIIKDFVEIGSNVTIDRGTIGYTIIGEGTKIDNLVHIAHNVKVGKDCLIMGQVGIAGSTVIGDNVILCGQVGISDHLTIGDRVIVYAKSGVFKSLPKDGKYSGIPARKHQMVLKALARLYRW